MQCAGCRFLTLGNLLQKVDDREVCRAGLGRKAWGVVTEVLGIDSRVSVDLSGEKSGAKWTERHEADAERITGSQHVVFLDVARPQGILALDSGNWLYGMRTPYCLCRRFGQAEVFDLAGGDQFSDGARHVLNGYIWIDTMLVEQIDTIRAQSPEHRIDHVPDMLRPTVQAIARAIRIDAPSEVCRDDDLVPNGREGLTQQFFVRKWAVRFGAIEERHPHVHGGTDDLDAFVSIASSPPDNERADGAAERCA